jgi:hypothetical protein
LANRIDPEDGPGAPALARRTEADLAADGLRAPVFSLTPVAWLRYHAAVNGTRRQTEATPRRRAARNGGGWVCALLVLLVPVTAPASHVPLFRCALERWSPAEFEAVIFHRGMMDEDVRTMVESLRPVPGKPPANLRVNAVNVSGQLDEPTEKLWRAQNDPALPWLVLRAPDSADDTPPVWAGPLDGDVLKRLTDSPARREIVRRLLKGESAVWVLVEGGDPMRDEVAVDRLTEALKEGEKTIQLPPRAAGDPPPRSALPLAVNFSLVRVARNNPAEDLFVRLLLHGEEEAGQPARPVALPVFGRGRVLAALSGRGISAEGIAEVCAFLCGACACEVKGLNPGKDLLLAADWESIFTASPASPGKRSPPTPDTPASPPAPAPPLAAATPAPAPAPPPAPRRWLLGGVALAAVLVIVTGALAFRSKSRP